MRKVVDRVQLVDKLIYYMQYPFVKYALVVGILIALCSSLFGATLVLKRFSFIGDGLSHVAFGAMAIGSVLKLTNNTIIVMPVTVAAAILILMSGQNAKLKGDAAIAMMSVGALAVGYLIMNVFSTSANVSGDVVWFNLNTYIDNGRSVAVYSDVNMCNSVFLFILQQDICSHI